MMSYNSYALALVEKQRSKSKTLSQATGRITSNYKLDWVPSRNGEESDDKEKELQILRSKRNTINAEILKQLRLKTGAQNMLEALRESKDKERRRVLEMELSFVDSNLQLLREALAEMNSPVLSDGILKRMPLIPLAMKQSTDINVKVTFLDFILEHYSENVKLYEENVNAFQNLRKESLEVKPDKEGIQTLCDYINQLYYVEHRFFPGNRSMGIYFQWYDAVSGFPETESSIAFEKASILYNLGSLWSQIGAKQNREEEEGCIKAEHSFCRAAGYFDHLRNTYPECISRDMQSDTLALYTCLTLAQAQECLYDLFCINHDKSVLSLIKRSAEAAEVADAYDVPCICLKNEELQRYLPQTWRSLILIKSLFYKALSHCSIAESLLRSQDMEHKVLEEILRKVLVLNSSSLTVSEFNTLLASQKGKKRLARSHLRTSLRYLEDSIRKHRSCKMLRKIGIIEKILQHENENTLRHLNNCEDEEDFVEVVSPSIRGAASRRAVMLDPDYTSLKTVDFFRDLGPLTVFSANSQWSAPRKISLLQSSKGYGCTLCGSSPVSVQHVEENGIAKAWKGAGSHGERALKIITDEADTRIVITEPKIGPRASKQGLRSGDFIVKLNGRNVKWAKHKDVIDTMVSAQGQVDLEVVSPQSITRVPSNHSAGSSLCSARSECSSETSSVSLPTDVSAGEKLRPSRGRKKEKGKKSRAIWQPS